MNHLTALQRTDGRWDYTRNGRAAGYCHAYEPLTEDGRYLSAEMAKAENEKHEPFIHRYHADGHATKEEACECYKQYLLDIRSRFPAKEPDNPTQQHKCEVCGAWTACMATIGPYRIVTVCPEHCTKEHVAPLFKIGESWES